MVVSNEPKKGGGVPAGSAGPHPRERRLESHAGTDEPPRRLPRNLLRLLCSLVQFSKLHTSTRTFASSLFAENRCWQESQTFRTIAWFSGSFTPSLRVRARDPAFGNASRLAKSLNELGSATGQPRLHSSNGQPQCLRRTSYRKVIPSAEAQSRTLGSWQLTNQLGDNFAQLILFEALLRSRSRIHEQLRRGPLAVIRTLVKRQYLVSRTAS